MLLCFLGIKIQASPFAKKEKKTSSDLLLSKKNVGQLIGLLIIYITYGVARPNKI